MGRSVRVLLALMAVAVGGSSCGKGLPSSGKLLVVWALDNDGQSYEVTLYNKGQGPLHVDRLGVEQNDQTLNTRLSLPGPHTLAPGEELTVRMRVRSEPTERLRTLIVESDAENQPVVRLPLDLSVETDA